jgi:hypothetical protein
MALGPTAVGHAPPGFGVIVCVSAWMEDHPSPLRVVVRVVEPSGSTTTLASASVDDACAEVRRALTDLAARPRSGPP